ncbi:hypothetical protein [Undibacterium oligocarboniphilum]|uniref:Uncharacterized protein n=1 Tax=Undibacterium oligocarboniphilum TaxID=666702 RepID=A0A850QIS5_9BURK|nr:hypothetical protein [Undibacterium oligocarboniphilum]MBC3871417.1 hypothetical protein [Undibacterium oligocarboniphilum]NVO79007.1 hypothetical protein [Undibacterium oligocarboniphilum]
MTMPPEPNSQKVDLPEPVQSNYLRDLVDAILNIDNQQANDWRTQIRDDKDPQFSNASDKWKFAVLSLTEKSPAICVLGILGWLYLSIWAILKLTILI